MTEIKLFSIGFSLLILGIMIGAKIGVRMANSKMEKYFKNKLIEYEILTLSLISSYFNSELARIMKSMMDRFDSYSINANIVEIISDENHNKVYFENPDLEKAYRIDFHKYHMIHNLFKKITLSKGLFKNG